MKRAPSRARDRCECGAVERDDHDDDDASGTNHLRQAAGYATPDARRSRAGEGSPKGCGEDLGSGRTSGTRLRVAGRAWSAVAMTRREKHDCYYRNVDKTETPFVRSCDGRPRLDETRRGHTSSTVETCPCCVTDHRECDLAGRGYLTFITRQEEACAL